MANSYGKGSIILKLLIVILLIVLVAVIIIPGKIWKEEAREEKTAHDNMESIFETESFFYKKYNKYTNKPAELLRVVQQDSSLLQLNQVVIYTRELDRAIDKLLDEKLVRAIKNIKVNMENIKGDLESNRRNFKAFEKIKNEAEELEMKIGEMNSPHDFPNYSAASTFLDSLIHLRRNMSDYSLQICASKSKHYTDTLQTVLDKINIKGMQKSWNPLSKRLSNFSEMVNHSPLVNITSVGDRVKDFRKVVDVSFEQLSKIDIPAALKQTSEANKIIDAKYKKFLNDFIITSKPALYKLTRSDSLVLHLTEDNFYSPVVTKEMYKIIISDDSSSVKVESPVLLNECKNNAAPLASQIRELPILNALSAYLDTLHSITNSAYKTRKIFRKNTDLFIAYKEIENYLGKYDNISIVNAYRNSKEFADNADSTESFSDLKTYTENALNGIRIFKQAYQKKFFGNLDTLHNNIINSYAYYDSILNAIKRRPKDIKDFTEDMDQMNKLLQGIKNAGTPEVKKSLTNLEKNLGDLYLFESEGKQITVYGVFYKDIKNFGYIFKGTKSWEEKKKNK